MARTIRNDEHKKWQGKENADNRREHDRKVRHKAKVLLHVGEIDSLPYRRRTQGWITH